MSLSLPLEDPNGRQYSRDSFDRFGDDLCELLLSYLPLKDKFQFECVSKQWRRLVFNKVIHFDGLSLTPYSSTYEELDVKFKHLKTILKKCHNMTTISLYMNSKTVSFLSLLSDNCQRLKSIELVVNNEVSSESMTAFGQTLGSKVEAINIWHLSTNIKLLSWCPNLKRLKCHECDDWLSLVGNQLVPELIQLNRISVKSGQMSAFVKLVDKYKNTMKNIEFSFDYDENIDLIFQQLYRLNNLECLHFIHLWSRNEFDLTPKIALLSQYCLNLSKIVLNIDKVSLSPPSKQITSIKSLRLGFNEIPDNFFANLSLLTPNLKEFEFTAYEDIYSNKDLNDLSRMKHLKKLVLIAVKCDHSTDDSAVIQLLNNCKQLKELRLCFRSNVTVQTISALKELANDRHKETIRFWSHKSPELLQSLTEMPENLLIKLI